MPGNVDTFLNGYSAIAAFVPGHLAMNDTMFAHLRASDGAIFVRRAA